MVYTKIDFFIILLICHFNRWAYFWWNNIGIRIYKSCLISKSQINVEKSNFIILAKVIWLICYLIIILTFLRSFILYFFARNSFNTLKIIISFNVKKKILTYTIIRLILSFKRPIRILELLLNCIILILL